MPFGKMLRELRESNKKSLDTAAKEIGITKSSLAMYERNERIPRDEVKVRIASYYHKTVGELFFGQNEHV